MAISAIAGRVVREAIRQKVVYVTVLFTLLLFSIEPMLPSFKVGLRIQLFGDIALGIAYIALAIIAIAISVNQLPAEIEKRTIYNILSKPVHRSEFLVGKYVGTIVVLFVCALLMGLAIVGFVFGYFGQVSYGILQGVATAFFESILISAFATLVSTFASPTVNVFVCLLFYFIGHVKNNAVAPMIKSDGLSQGAGLMLKYLLPSLENFNVNEAAARGVVLKVPLLLELFLYAIVFSAVFLVGGSFIFARKEI